VDLTELAWAAGFFDGEGSIGLRQQTGRPCPYPTISIGQVDPRPLERFQRAIGGHGKIYGPRQRTAPSGRPSKPFWEWQSNRFEVIQAVYALLWRFLSEPKREQVRRTMLELRDARRLSTGRAAGFHRAPRTKEAA